MYRRNELEKILDEYGYMPPKDVKIARSPTMNELQFAILIKISKSLEKLTGSNLTEKDLDKTETSDG